MPVTAANGIEINYTDSGGEGPAVVFSHGYLMDHTMFGRQVTALAPEYRVITWDQRGHGGTRATGAFTYWDSAADVLALLDHLGIERAVLAGMSQGGFLSLRAALTVPDRVRALVLIDSQAGQEDPANAPGYEQMHQAWLDNGPGPVQEVVASIILGPGQWEGWYAKWNEQYAQWAPDDLGQLTWPFRCLMDRDDLTGRARRDHLPHVDRARDGRRRDPSGAGRSGPGRPGRPGHVHRRRGRSARLERDPPGRGEPGHPRVLERAGRRVKRAAANGGACGPRAHHLGHRPG